MEVKENSLVKLHIDIRLKDGSLAESTRNLNEPMSVLLGQGELSEKVETALLGLQVGDKAKVMLLPEDAFGEPHPANVFSVPKQRFAAVNSKEPLEIGTIVAFTQQDGTDMPGIIRSIDDDEISVDFNHPLSGQVILFDIAVIEVLE